MIEKKGANLQEQGRRQKFEGRKEPLKSPPLRGDESCAQAVEKK